MRSTLNRRWWLWLLLAAFSLALLYWALRAVPLTDIAAVLSQLTAVQMIIFLIVNSLIVLLLGLRWWVILRAQGHQIPYLATTRYRLAAFGVSYFTPGPQFGGEPVQVYLVRQRHSVPGSTALASVALDKAIELLSNFAFLAFGLAVVLQADVLELALFNEAQWLSILFFLLPVLYLLALWLDRRPLSWLASLLPARVGSVIQHSEHQLARLLRERPALLTQTLLASLAIWLALLFEYWLVLRFLGLHLDFVGLIALVVAARLAMLAPTPGALGALEAAQVLAVSALGYDPAYAIGLSLLIRARDIFFGLLGLALGATSRERAV